MRKIISIPIFFIIVFCICLPVKPEIVARAENLREIVLVYEERQYAILESEIIGDNTKVFRFSSQELLIKVFEMGFTPSQSLRYVYPGLGAKINEISTEINSPVRDASLDVSGGNAKVIEERDGILVDRERLEKMLFYGLASGEVLIKINIPIIKINPVRTTNEVKKLTAEKSRFITYINGSNQEGRIHNIKQATKVLNGVCIMPNETLSFNSLVGDTTRENGYELAKVIIKGKYEEDYGGGVCQVATTLYNSALLAGLEVVKVRPHTLKVGYVAGSFDAMVSFGGSDLVIKNPYSTPIFIYGNATDYDCEFKIFGAPNEYEIKRRAEKIDFSEEEFPEVSYKSEGYLDYYKDGIIINSKKIRTDSYKKVSVN